MASGLFTPTELATLRALVIERLTIEEIAQRDGCSRHAVMARLTGNSRGQGGILKKARALLPRARALGVEHRPPAPLLLGRHLLALGLSPGPAIGEILKQVYEQQLDGDIRTVEEAIAEAKRITAGG